MMINKTSRRFLRALNCQLMSLIGLLLLANAASGEIFVHTVDNTNLSGHMTRLSHSSTQGKPDQLIFVTPRFGTYNPHTVGVWFEPATSRWTIYNEDRTPLPEDAQFNVIALDPSLPQAFTHTATKDNTVDYYTFISHPSSDYNPEATLLITPNWSESYVPGPLGVWFDGERWSIYRQDKKPLAEGTRFNVLVLKEGPNKIAGSHPMSVSTVTHIATDTNTRGHVTNLNRTDPEEAIFITHNWGTEGPYNQGVPGVWYNGENWTIINQGREKIENKSKFNCFIFTSLGKPAEKTMPKEIDTRMGWIKLQHQGDFEIEFTLKFTLDGKSRVGRTGTLNKGASRLFRVPMRAEDIRLTGQGTQNGISRVVIDKVFSGVPNATYAVSAEFSDPEWKKVE